MSSKDEVSVAESKASDLSESASPSALDAKRMAELGESDEISDMGDSRTMLVRVSSAGITINWLEIQEVRSPLGRELNTSFQDEKPFIKCSPNALKFSVRVPTSMVKYSHVIV